MHYPDFDRSPFNMGNCTSRQVEEYLRRSNRLLVPLGAVEAYGQDTPLGAVTAVCEALTVEVSRASGVLFAPSLAYGCSLPFSAFAGTGGIRPRALCNLLTDLLRQWGRQGFKRVMLLDMSWGNGEAIEEALERVRGERGTTVTAYRWEEDPTVRECVQQRFGRVEQGRWDIPLLCVVRYVLGPSVCAESILERNRPVDTVVRNWIRRGRDPEQFRKLFASALLWSGSERVNPQQGAELFALAVQGARKLLDCFD